MDDVSYLNSTQHRYFTFTHKRLTELREHTAKLAHATPSTNPPLTASEELTLLTYYTTVLSTICHHFSVSSSVRSTALTFLSRLYLRLSPSTVHPKTLLLPLLYLALKSELGAQSTSWFIRTAAQLQLNTTKEELLAPEIMIAMNLRWSFLVRHPWRGLEGVKAELLGLAAGSYKGPNKSGVTGEGLEKKRIEASCGEARNVLTGTAVFGDAQFLYTPPQVMLAALWGVDKELVEMWVGLKLEGEVKERLLEKVRECEEGFLRVGDWREREALLRRPVVEVDAEMKREARRIDKKLFFWKEGRQGGGDDAAEKRKAEEEEERKRKKRKMEEEKRAADDVFGGKLQM